MSDPKIRSNYHWRQTVYGYEVPQSVLDDYDWLSDDGKFDGWIHYRNTWYHLSDFLAVHNTFHNPNPPDWMKPWHGYLSDSYFSGILIRFDDNDPDLYQIATYY